MIYSSRNTFSYCLGILFQYLSSILPAIDNSIRLLEISLSKFIFINLLFKHPKSNQEHGLVPPAHGEKQAIPTTRDILVLARFKPYFVKF
jgi:hypothetical protein